MVTSSQNFLMKVKSPALFYLSYKKIQQQLHSDVPISRRDLATLLAQLEHPNAEKHKGALKKAKELAPDLVNKISRFYQLTWTATQFNPDNEHPVKIHTHSEVTMALREYFLHFKENYFASKIVSKKEKINSIRVAVIFFYKQVSMWRNYVRVRETENNELSHYATLVISAMMAETVGVLFKNKLIKPKNYFDAVKNIVKPHQIENHVG